MFRMWGKIWENGHMLQDIVITNEEDITRTQKVFQALNKICYAFDLGCPIWLDSNVTEFKRHQKVRFFSDSFIEDINFDYLELIVIEED